ncbi:MAG: 16S rRNA (cytosine(1402)-N(4))-methyltransferase RsmH [Candidatus Marinimicrobia bacterium]|nr:16S rRNA (cytosine(1402)-N(4))-methyltransferase RsmH [Candidatus Neomarinimicrobiota bacterium]
MHSAPAVGAGPHLPVMVEEVLAQLVTTSSGLYVDGTLGGGGHASALLARLASGGRVLGVDLDPGALDTARRTLAGAGDRISLRQGSFTQLPAFLEELGMTTCQGLLLDLGLSTLTLESSGRGFSFQLEEPLDMRFDPSQGEPLAQVLLRLSRSQLADIIYRYGEERRSRAIARAIRGAAEAGRMLTSGDLAATVRSVVKGPQATKTLARVFQALRIYINGELDNLQAVLDSLPQILEAGRRVVIISYHSLEDRLVKHFFIRESKACLCPPQLPSCQCNHQATLKVVSRKPITPSAKEQAFNPRSRSAKLRVAQRL